MWLFHELGNVGKAKMLGPAPVERSSLYIRMISSTIAGFHWGKPNIIRLCCTRVSKCFKIADICPKHKAETYSEDLTNSDECVCI